MVGKGKGGVMDIQKARETFQKFCEKNFDFENHEQTYFDDQTQCYENDAGEDTASINMAWQAWQQAQIVAVPEGFVLVERDLIQSIHQSCVNCLDIDFKPVFKAAVSTIRDSVKPLIEAQGQIDISKFDGYTPMLSRSKEQA